MPKETHPADVRHKEVFWESAHEMNLPFAVNPPGSQVIQFEIASGIAEEVGKFERYFEVSDIPSLIINEMAAKAPDSKQFPGSSTGTQRFGLSDPFG
jgi:hypothetical protein